MQEHLERMREVDELGVVRREQDGFARLRGAVQVEPQDVVQEEVRLLSGVARREQGS